MSRLTKNNILYPDGTPAEQRQRKWDLRWIAEANLKASFSGDPSRHVGCVIVGAGETDIVAGWNDFPRGVEDKPHRRSNRADKLRFTEHAERNAIYNAARQGVSTLGAKAYCTYHPCADCARGLIQAGIVEVVCPDPGPNNPHWAEDFVAAQEMFTEAGVAVRYIDWSNT